MWGLDVSQQHPVIQQQTLHLHVSGGGNAGEGGAVESRGVPEQEKGGQGLILDRALQRPTKLLAPVQSDCAPAVSADFKERKHAECEIIYRPNAFNGPLFTDVLVESRTSPSSLP